MYWRGAIFIVRPDLDHITEFNHECTLDRLYTMPDTVLQDLQVTDLILDQDGHRAGVGMVMHA
jgi:hypothetical protein